MFISGNVSGISNTCFFVITDVVQQCSNKNSTWHQLGESQCQSGSVCGFEMQVAKQVLLRDKIRRMFRGGGSPTLVDSMAKLESIGDINLFRVGARELGVAVKDCNASGQLVHRRKADMLLNCREVLKELFHATDAGAVQGHNELLASENPSSLVLHWVTCHQAPSPGSLLPLIDCIDL